MKKSLAIATSFGLALFAISAMAATPPKPGAICTKVGLTQNYNGMKYTCTKSGKKLVWDNGSKIFVPKTNVAPTPSPILSSNSDLDSGGYPKDAPAPGRTCP